MSARYLGGVIAQTQLPLNPAAGNAANGVFTLNQYMQAVKNATWPGFDPYFKQNVLLLHGNGTNGAQNNTFLDSSTNNFTITRNGNTTQGTFSPFSLAAGEWSNYFDGSGDGLSVPANAAFDFGSGNFTVEAWVYLAGNSPLDGNSRRIANIFSVSTSSVFNFNFIIFGNSTTTGTGLEIYNGSNIVNVAGTINQNTWNHVAVSKSGTSVYFWLNGTQLGSTQTTSGNWGSSVNGAQVGRTLVPSYTFDLNGYISNVRVLKGTALYTATFTPPTTPLTAITNTSLLTCQSNRFVDNSTNAFAITRNGDVRVTPFSPFAPTAAYSPGTNGGSGYFDGTGDFLTAPASASWQFTGDHTIEAWIYITVLADGTIYGTGGAGAADQFTYTSTGQLYWGNQGTATGVIGTNRWIHVAASRSGTTLKIFVDGVERTSATVSGTIGQNATAYIGRRSDGNNPVNGYISNLRIVNGTAVYTSAFTPPTAPVTAITNTVLLLNFTNAGIFDQTGKNVLETVGNAQIDTAVKKFGDGSLEFDGNGDYLLIPDSDDWHFGSGDFTAECWVYPTASPNQPIIMGQWSGSIGSTTLSWVIILSNNSSRFLRFALSTNGSGVLTDSISSSALTLNDWNHIALVRSGNVFTAYLNGTSAVTYTITAGTALYNATNQISVGASSAGTQAFQGYIDDLRITKGVARYTSNFAVPYLPQGPLPLVGGPYIPNTVLMLPGTGTNGAQNNTFLDSSTNNFTITRNGNTTQGTFSPFSRANGYWGNYFDGSGDFLDVPDNAALEIGASSFCIEAWINPNALPTTGGERYIVAKWISASRSFAFGYVNASGTIQLRLVYSTTGSTSLNISQNAPIVANAWQHIAVTRDGTTARFFLNGVQQGSTQTLNATFWDSTEVLTIGRFGTGGGSQFDGYLSNLRLVIGSAVYTSNFTPTGPLTAIANTQLLTCQSNRFIDNSTNNFSVTPSGNVKVTTFSPFEYLTAYSPATNGGSGYFDGTGDYLSVPSGAFSYTSGNAYTCEIWIYPTSYPTQYPNLITVSGSTSNVFSVYIENNGRVAVSRTNVGDVISSASGVIQLNQWNHIAIGKDSSNSARIWVNGTSVATGTDANNYTAASNLIASNSAGTQIFAGYMASIRSVTGSDVYGVGNTTISVPTTPLTAIANTSLLLNFTNAAIYDASMTNDLETVGNAQVSTTQSKWGGGSMYFDGTGDYLIIPSSSEFDFGSGDFTLEFWINFNSLSGAIGIIGKRAAEGNYSPFLMEVSSSTLKLYISTSGSSWAVSGLSTSTLSTGTWYHIAAVRSGTTVYLFVNGISVGSTGTATGALMTNTTSVTIGQGSITITAAVPLNGYISDLRILKGVALLPTPLQTSQWQDQ